VNICKKNEGRQTDRRKNDKTNRCTYYKLVTKKNAVLSLSLSRFLFLHVQNNSILMLIIINSLFLSRNRHSFVSFLSFNTYSRWCQSLLCIIRQEHKQSSPSHNNILDKNNDIRHLILLADQSAHARACFK